MIILAFGSNISSSWGHPKYILYRAMAELAKSGIGIKEKSKIYLTKAHAYTPQPNYLNAAAIAATSLPPCAVLQVLKRIEFQAGRAKAKLGPLPYRSWMPRPLDIDIVCYQGVIRNWQKSCPQLGRRVILPHPRAHERAFVLAPIAEVAPFWHHPVFGLTASQMLKRPKTRATGTIIGSEPFPT